MENFIKVWTRGSIVFLNITEISRISFSKGGNSKQGENIELKQGERIVKVQFKDSSTGTYIGPKVLEDAFNKTFATMLNKG